MPESSPAVFLKSTLAGRANFRTCGRSIDAIDPPCLALQACRRLQRRPPLFHLTFIVTNHKVRSPDSSPDNPSEASTGVPDFERSLAELEAIVGKLEAGDLSLDESLKQFERGVQLTRVCQTALQQAEQKVEILLRKTGTNEFEAAPFDAGEQDGRNQ